MENCENWYRLCLNVLWIFGILFAMLLGYNLKWRKQQIELFKRTERLEKKNGQEQHQINELNEKIKELETKLTT